MSVPHIFFSRCNLCVFLLLLITVVFANNFPQLIWDVLVMVSSRLSITFLYLFNSIRREIRVQIPCFYNTFGVDLAMWTFQLISRFSHLLSSFFMNFNESYAFCDNVTTYTGFLRSFCENSLFISSIVIYFLVSVYFCTGYLRVCYFFSCIFGDAINYFYLKA